jgi:ribonuclease-3
MIDLANFEKKIGVTFRNTDLLRQAFVHRSYLNENKWYALGHNERLEFLGDAVLELAVTEYLYDKFPDKAEGDLTSYRSALVNANTCASVATDIGVNDFLLLSKGEAKDIGRARTFILANTLESIIGAIYLDQGYDVSRKFISEHVFNRIDDVLRDGSWIDNKSLFQEKAQEEESVTPAYKTLKEAGPDHDKHFTVGVYLNKELIGTGDGKSKQDAEQDAAKKALQNKGWN